jgi:hypothetical protein
VLAAALLAALAASPTVGTKGIGTFGVKADVGEFFTSTLQKELHERGVELVVSPDKACDLCITGTVAQLGDKTRVELELSNGGKRIARHSAVGTDAASLVDQVPALAEQLAAEIKAAGPVEKVEKAETPAEKSPEVKPAEVKPAEPAKPVVAEAAAPSKSTPWWIPLLGTVVFLGAGGGCFAVASSDHSSLTSGGMVTMPMFTYADAMAVANHGKTFEALGWVAMGVAGAAAITAVVLWFVTRSAP